MWRTLLIVLLAGLLIGSTAANVMLLRQSNTAIDEINRQRARAAAAEATQASLQQRVTVLEALQSATPTPTPDRASLGGGQAPALVQIEQIARQVEVLRGLSRMHAVPVQVVDSATVSRYVGDGYVRSFPAEVRGIEQKLLVALGAVRADQNVFEAQQALARDQALATYSTTDKTVYVAADPIQPLRPEVQAAVAHEFVRALQDQAFDLDRLQPAHPANHDAQAALSALLEGDAELTTQAWMQQNLTPTTLDNLPDSETDIFDRAPSIVQADWRFTRMAGLQFAQKLYQRAGSFDTINAAYTSAPPLSTAQVLDPNKYLASVAPVAVALPDVASTLGNGWTQVASNVLGQFHLFNVVAEGSDSAAASHAVVGWAGDRWQLLERNGQSAVVLRTAWDSATSAQDFFGAYAAELKVRYRSATIDADTPARLALTDSLGAAELRMSGAEVLVVIAYDRPSADSLAAAVGGF